MASDNPVNVPTEAEKDDGTPFVSILLCILNPRGHGGSSTGKIWRRIAVPSDFNLLSLHLVLQNAFNWENAHLHTFTQPRQAPELSIPTYPGFGRTDIDSYPRLDGDVIMAQNARSYQAVIGMADAGFPDMLTAADQSLEGPNGLVYVQHSHPHAKIMGRDNQAEFPESQKEVLEERSFLVADVLTKQDPLLLYEYDFGVSHEVTIVFEGKFEATEGINYPTCLAGAGASRAEDGDDMDDDGNPLPTYNYNDFSVAEVVANLEQTFEDLWPVGPDAVDSTQMRRCFLCRYNRECGRRRQCTGSCCDYCLKSPVTKLGSTVTLGLADSLFDAARDKIVESRRLWVLHGQCNWVEDDGQPCAECSQD